MGLAVVMVGAGCSGVDLPNVSAPGGESTSSTGSTVAAPDRSDVNLAGVEGAADDVTVTGAAAIEGTVTGPGGPVPAAVVEAVRVRSDGAEGRVETTTDAAGVYRFDAVAGGRWRLRAYLAPTLSQLEPTILFLEDADTHQVDLTVASFAGADIAATVAPDPPQVGELVTLSVLVVTRTVEADGVVTATPSAGVLVDLSVGGSWELVSDDPVATDGAGRVSWTLRCTTPGVPRLDASIGTTNVVPIVIPACVNPSAST